MLFADETQIGLGALIGVVATAITQLVVNLYGKKKSSEIEASDHAFTMLKSIIDELKEQIDANEKKYEEKIENLNQEIKELKDQHMDCREHSNRLENEIQALKEKYVNKPNGTS